MTVYSGSLALQTIGLRVRRTVSAVIVTVLAFALILWLHGGADTAYFVNLVVAALLYGIYRLLRMRGRARPAGPLRATDH